MSKPLFDTIRQLLGRGLTQDEVDAVNASLESRKQPDPPSTPERHHTPAKLGPHGLALIKQFEGCAKKRGDGMIEAYPDPGTGAEPWTIGWGNTMMDGRRVKRGDVITQARADSLLAEELVKYERDVVRALGSAIGGTSQQQFDALVSFHYNTGAIGTATLTKKHKAGDFAGAAREFGRWNRAGARVMRGLTRRREAEAALYRSGS